MISSICSSVEDYDKDGPVIGKSGWLQSFPNTESGKQRTEMNSQDKGLSKQGARSVGSKFESHKDAVQEQSRVITHAIRAAMLFLFVSVFVSVLEAVS